MKKRIFTLTLLTLVFSLTACAKETTEQTVSAGSTPEIETVTEEESAAQEETAEETDAYAEPVRGEYSGWLCGLVSSPENEMDSDVLVLDPESGEAKKITTLEQIGSTQTCAVSPDGNWVAYTDWASEDHSEGVYLIVRNVEDGEEKCYLKDNGCDPLLAYMTWLPDNRSLLFNMSLKDQQYYRDMIGVLDIEAEEIRILD